MSDSMHDMPIPKLVKAIKEKAKNVDFLTSMVLNLLGTRLSNEYERAEGLQKTVNTIRQRTHDYRDITSGSPEDMFIKEIHDIAS